MRHSALPTIFTLSMALSYGSDLEPLRPDPANQSSNAAVAAKLRSSAKPAVGSERNLMVFAGDRVIPQIVDGAGWQSQITLVNLENRTVTFDLLFFADDGTDLRLSIVGMGIVRAIRITLAPVESATIDTAGTSTSLLQGWAYLSIPDLNDSIGGLTVFRQRIPGRQDSEAVVPVVSQFDDHFVLLYDNTSWTTAMAIANPTSKSVSVDVNVRAESGAVLQRRTLTLAPYEHRAFTIASEFSVTANARGKLEFMTTGFGVAVLGLRFNGTGSFTSFHALSNVDWM